MFAKLFPALLAGAVCVLSVPALAQNPTDYAWPGQGMNLSTPQQKQIQNIRQKYGADDARQAMQSSRPFSQEMQEIIAAKNFDEARARDLLIRRTQVQHEMQLQRMRQQHEIYQVLTPQQRELWQKKRERRFTRQQRQGWRGGKRGQNQNMQPCYMPY